MEKSIVKKEYYDNLDGVRGYAAVCIAMMHILENGGYRVSGFVLHTLVPSFTNFTFLFMMISAFSMCCGYYQRFKDHTIDLEYFYKRRYQRIWPYFAILCTLALIMSFSVRSLYEYLADLTLAFGLIPNPQIEVIGVGWFLGVVFVFYMVFPFFTFLIGTKKRAWLSFCICLMLNLLTLVRFRAGANREVFIYSAVYFMAGGLIYLYRNDLKKRSVSIISGVLTLILIVLYYTGHNMGDLSWLLIFSSLLCFLISIRSNAICNNRVARFLGSISMELYLSHMVIFRLAEKLHLTKFVAGHDAVSYFMTVLIVLAGTMIFVFAIRKMIQILERGWKYLNREYNR